MFILLEVSLAIDSLLVPSTCVVLCIFVLCYNVQGELVAITRLLLNIIG